MPIYFLRVQSRLAKLRVLCGSQRSPAAETPTTVPAGGGERAQNDFCEHYSPRSGR